MEAVGLLLMRRNRHSTRVRDHLWHQGYRAYNAFMCMRRHLSSYLAEVDLTDLTAPHNWYPAARKKKRNVFMHIGPTNSGKTFTALKRLQLSPSGIYCGPLRLLAWEVSERMNNADVPCSLITGQEIKQVEGAQHKACTVEMADLAQEFDCAVIDEFQMVGCPTRGYAFTRALLGLAVKELHLCGDPSAVKLVQTILASTGDTIEVSTYSRLSPLVPSKIPLKSFSKVKSGDCAVTFSRRNIYKIKSQIEILGCHKCSVVYGSLPPQSRTRQAVQFNNASDGVDVLVASDAIGMGLNLNIRRIIFSTMSKFDGTRERPLNSTEIKQIAGRAGRYGSRFPEGEVTCLKEEDLPLLYESLEAPTIPVEAAGLFPTYDLLALYSRLHPDLTFADVLNDFTTKAQLSSYYSLSNSDNMMAIAIKLEDLSMPLQDRYIFCCSPVDLDDHLLYGSLLEFATAYARDEHVPLNKYFTPGTMRIPNSLADLQELESIHKVLELYIWLSFRLENAFMDRELAISQLNICCLLVDEGLLAFGRRPSSRSRLRVLKCLIQEER